MAQADWEFVAGAYSATYGGTTIGTTKEGFKIRIEYQERPIQVDEYGLGEVDSLQAGVRVFVDLDYVEYGRIKGALNAQFSTEGDIYGNVGKLLSKLGGALILTPIIRTNNNDTWTFHKAIIVDNVPVLLSSALREGPVTFRVYVARGTGISNTGVYYTKS